MIALLCQTALAAALPHPAGADADERFRTGLRLALEQLAADPEATVRGERLYKTEAVYRFYTRREFSPVWNEGRRGKSVAADLLREVGGAATHGLKPGHYHGDVLSAKAGDASDRVELELLMTDAFVQYASDLLSGHVNPETIDPEWFASRRERDLVVLLEGALAGDSIAAALESVLPQHPGYQRLRDALERYRAYPAWEPVPDGPMLRPGDSDGRVVLLRRRLAATGLLADSEGGDAFDAEVGAALKRFQLQHGLDGDGVLGPATLRELNVPPRERARQIVVNLERWRWLPQDLGARHLNVNIADFSLVAVADGREVTSMRVIVGRSYRRTPVFTGRMSYIVLNPWWEVPRYLAVEDQLPLIRSDPGYIERMGFKVYGGGVDDPEVNPAEIDWTRLSHDYFPYRLRQAPGPLNALGQYKFMFPNKFSVYLHDTPSRYLFAKADRAFSSGCIRVENPEALAQFLLVGTADWTAARIRDAVAAGETRTIVLVGKVPVHLLYWTAWSGDDGIQFRRDVYDRDARVLTALGEDPPAEESLEVSP